MNKNGLNSEPEVRVLQKILHDLKIYQQCDLKSINTFDDFLKLIIYERLGFYCLKEIFEWIDSDEDGLINVSELSLALQDRVAQSESLKSESYQCLI